MNLIQSNVKTMSSREIAIMTDKQHSKVMRTIEDLLDKGVAKMATLTPYVNEQNGQSYNEYRLDKRDSLVLVARLSPEFTAAIVDRWQELEAKQVETPEQLMARALISAQSVIASKDAQIEAAQPAIRLESAISNDDSTLSMTEAGKKLQVKPRKFIEWLYQHKYIDASNMPYQRWINQGLLVISTIEKNGKPRSSTRVTGKGFAYFGGKLSELKFNNQQHFLFYK